VLIGGRERLAEGGGFLPRQQGTQGEGREQVAVAAVSHPARVGAHT